MELNKSHVGGLFTTKGADGTWVYQLVDVKGGWLLFYDFDGKYEKERQGNHRDWQVFKPTTPWPKKWKQYGWEGAEDIDRGSVIS